MYGVGSFSSELMTIRNQEIRNFTEECLRHVPEYFWTMAASTTGKYHPVYSLGEGGLVRHTKAAVSIALDLLSLEQYRHLSDARDCIIAALILHDTFKKGRDGKKWTVFDHPLIAAEFVVEMADRVSVQMKYVNVIRDLIATHMGQWTEDYDGVQRLQKPETEAQKFVHLCDFLASRKSINVDVK